MAVACLLLNNQLSSHGSCLTDILHVISMTYLPIAIHQSAMHPMNKQALNAVCNVQAKNAIFLRTSSCLTCFRGKHRSIVQSASVQSFATRKHISSLHNRPKYNRVSEIFQLHVTFSLPSDLQGQHSQQQFRLVKPQFESLCGRLSD